MDNTTCCVDGCVRPVSNKTHQLCKPHYYKKRIYGNPLKGGDIRQPAEGATCSEPNCHFAVESKGLCSKHYARLRLTGRLTLPDKPEKPTCSADNCNREVQGLGLCGKHYQRMRNSGSLADPKPVAPWPQCSAPDCGKPAKSRRSGLCGRHQYRADKYGTTDDPVDTSTELMSFIEGLMFAEPTGECVPWPGVLDPSGYGKIGGRLLAHRYSCQLANGEPPPGKPNALHCCGNRACVAPWHLYWGDWHDNAEDSRDHGTMTRGSNSRHAKLTEADINPIRFDPRTNAEIARDYGVSSPLISMIKNGKIWKHVPWEDPRDSAAA